MYKAFTEIDGNLLWKYDDEQMLLIPWGENGIRVRVTKTFKFSDENWALEGEIGKLSGTIKINKERAIVQNGNLKAVVTKRGKLTFYNNQGKILLEEYVRDRYPTQNVEDDDYYNEDVINEFNSALQIKAREFKPILGGDYSMNVRFESATDEKIYGMGQYQQPYLDLKYSTLELAHRNSQASVPFMVSNLGYGFLWNNPAIGKVTFGKNITEWHSEVTKEIDYWITAGESPAEIVENYANVVGKAPMMPEYAMGFWQCKLRYQTQDELLEVAREYKRRNLPISVIVIDFFHWTNQGDFKFDKRYWPNPEGMVKELKEMGIELMVSIWPTIHKTSENYQEMLEKGYLVRVDKGIRSTMERTVFFDATNPEARNFVWNKVKKNYHNKGIKIFWLDEAEPEYTVYDFDNYRYYLGPNVQVGNIYPLKYAQAFYEGMEEAGQKNIINLVRCAWVGSQKYGALVWSGDIDSSFKSLREQLQCGLNMGMAGIPWWTTDIGGFHGGDINSEPFRECLVRWFQFGVFCPVFRLHGDREPHSKPLGQDGGGQVISGAPNEVWSYGEEVYDILSKYLFMRERIKPYIKKLMKEAHESGTPVMRPIFYDFHEDQNAWVVEDQYMFGTDVLVAPVLYENQYNRVVYLPKGETWKNAKNGEIYKGGQTVSVECPLDTIPIFLREGVDLVIYEGKA